MKAKRQRVPTRFAPDIRFELRPATDLPYRLTQMTELERLKGRLLLRQLDEPASLEVNALVRRAANEAAALAWVSPFPLLLFPELFTEKARTARRQATRQARIRERSRQLNQLVAEVA